MDARSFLVVCRADKREMSGLWPLLGMMPESWRRRAAGLMRPRCVPALAAPDGSIAGHSLAMMDGWPARKTVEAITRARSSVRPLACGWAGPPPPPEVPGVAWRLGKLFALLPALGVFHPHSMGNLSGLTVMVSGEDRAALAAAARYLAGIVRRLILVSPGEHFRNRLAAQILCESGLAVLTRAVAPDHGWDVALDLQPLQPRLRLGARIISPRAVFPSPLLYLNERVPAADHPVWGECHLACLAGESLPHETSLGSLRRALALAERADLSFSLA